MDDHDVALDAHSLLSIMRSRGLSVYLNTDGQPMVGGNKALFTTALQKVLARHRDAVVRVLKAEAEAEARNKNRPCFYLLPGGKSVRVPMPSLIPAEATAWHYEGETTWRRIEKGPESDGNTDGEGRGRKRQKGRGRTDGDPPGDSEPGLFA